MMLLLDKHMWKLKGNVNKLYEKAYCKRKWIPHLMLVLWLFWNPLTIFWQSHRWKITINLWKTVHNEKKFFRVTWLHLCMGTYWCVFALLFVIQGVHKVSLQFKKIIKKWNDEISQWGLFYVNQYFIKFLLTH